MYRLPSPVRIGLALALFLPLSTARADPEPVATYDARAAALGGSGVAFGTGAAALYHNPAFLAREASWVTTVGLANLLVEFEAPFAGRGSEQAGGVNYAPLGFIGFAARVTERLHVGFGAYALTGFGGGYDAVSRIGLGGPCLVDPETGVENEDGTDVCLASSESQTVALVVGELAAPAAFKISDALQIGVTLRLPFARQQISLHQEVFRGSFVRVDQKLFGVGIPGVLVGAAWTPRPGVTLGLAYRSKVHTQMSGDTTIETVEGDPLRLDTSTRWRVPHMVRVGATLEPPLLPVLVTGELRVQFHREANRAQRFVLDHPILSETNVDFSWRNVLSGSLGLEYAPAPSLPLRVGLSAARSATPKSTVSPFTPPPGLLWAAYVGAGVRRPGWALDLALSWAMGSATIREAGEHCVAGAPIKLGCPGHYGVRSFTAAASVTWRPADRYGQASEQSSPRSSVAQVP